MDPIWGYQAINVEAQQGDPSSLLHWMRNMIALRKLFHVFGRGTLEFLHPENRKILAYVRAYQSEDGHCETVLCVANLSRFAQPVALDLAKFAGRQPIEMLGYVTFPEVGKSPYPLTLAPYGFLWLELQERQAVPEAPVVESLADMLAERLGESLPMPQNALGRVLHESGQTLLEQVLPGYIAQRRWFGGKSRTIVAANVASVTSLPGDEAALSTINVLYDDGTADLYQLPLAMADGSEAESLRETTPAALIATVNQPEGAVILYDAAFAPAFRNALLRMITRGAEVAMNLGGSAASLSTTKAVDFDGAELLATASRVGSVEQSNTSIIYGEKAILKLFRRLRMGVNPDVEVTRFLTEVGRYPNVPAYLGDLHRTDDGTTLAFLQAFAPNEGDGWAWTLEELDRYFDSVSNCPLPKSEGSAPLIGNQPDIPPEIEEHAGLFLEAAQLLGRRTGELHVALSTPTENQAFRAERFTQSDLAAERERIETQTAQALDLLAGSLEKVPAEIRPMAARLLGERERVGDLLTGLEDEPGLFGQRIRIHGDYHLGQTLRSRSDFMLVDFEGEPARTLEERRRKQSPLRDVAGMLRSFSYAAQAALQRHAQRRPENGDALRPWARLWERASAARFLQGYSAAVAARPDLLPATAQAQKLLAALLTEKAFYELSYELNNRPGWLLIPLNGILELLQLMTASASSEAAKNDTPRSALMATVPNLEPANEDKAQAAVAGSPLLVCLPSMASEASAATLRAVAEAFRDRAPVVASPDIDTGQTATDELPRLVPYAMPRGGSEWVLDAADYMAAADLAREHGATQILLLGPDAASLRPAALIAMQHGLQHGADLAMPLYQTATDDGLVNSALLFPLTRALFADVRFPLPLDLGLSARMLQRLAGAASRVVPQPEASLLWPVAEASVAGFTVRQVQGGERLLPQPTESDLNVLLPAVMGSLFADLENKASFWQRARVLPAARAAVRGHAAESNYRASEEIRSLVDNYRAAFNNLREIWSLVLPPQSLLALKKLSSSSAESFYFAPALWARTVYDFALAFHLRTLNRGHLLGALTPLYLAWVAGLLRTSESGEMGTADVLELTAHAFEQEKPYLVSRWRWPDRFNP